MTRSRNSALTAALLLATFGSSCNLLHRKPPNAVAAPPPTPAPAQQAPVPPPKQGEEQVALPTPPQIAPKSPDLQQQPTQPKPSVTNVPPPRPSRKKTVQKANRETPPPPQEPAVAASQPAPQAGAPDESATPQVPQLEQILSPEQQQAYSEEIDNNIGKAEKTMAGLQGRRLNREQKTYFARVRAFVDQAKEARKTDLFRAKNLAERASVLAEDLNRSVQ